MKLTILTPTYNRAELLKKCYESLCHQTNKNFIWLIVDDGSTDKTEVIVKNFIAESNIKIKYLKKQNGGKHTALNYGVKKIETTLTLILDSDDQLTQDAVNSIYCLYKKYENEHGICGFTFLKQYPDGKIMGDVFPKEGKYNFIKWRVNGIVSGDQCDVFYTKIMREYPFSEYPGERFIGESTSWIRMANKYNMICKNKAIYVADYLEGGLTKEGRAMRLNCPRGGMEYANVCMSKGVSISRKIKSAVLYVCYGRTEKISFWNIINNSNSKIITIVMYPIGVIVYKKWKIKYKN